MSDTEDFKIPLRNIAGDIVDYALVSQEDHERVSRFRWSRSIRKDDLLYAQGYVNGKNVKLHHFVIDKPLPEKHVVDHIDGNGLNNRRDNLEIASKSKNAQNKKKLAGTSSNYTGVSWSSSKNKWETYSSKVYLGCFEDEVEAAKTYDKFVLLTYGKNAKTNGLVQLEDVQDIDISTLSKTRKPKELPQYITLRKGRFQVQVKYDGKSYYSSETTLENAEKKVEEFKKTIQDVKDEKERQRLAAPILRNSKGNPIMIVSKNGVDDEVEIPESMWYDITKYSWCKKDNHYKAVVNGVVTMLQRLITNAPPDTIVIHVNDGSNSVMNNNLDNLRVSTECDNSHNRKKKKGTTSEYSGVSKVGNRWRAAIGKGNDRYYLGTFGDQVSAAIAYNSKATELYGNCANLNDISQEDIEKLKPGSRQEAV